MENGFNSITNNPDSQNIVVPNQPQFCAAKERIKKYHTKSSVQHSEW